MEPTRRCSGRWAPEHWRGSRRGLAAGSPVRSEAGERPLELRRGCRHGHSPWTSTGDAGSPAARAPRVRCSRDARRVGSGGIGARERRCDEHRTRPHGPPGWKRRGKKISRCGGALAIQPAVLCSRLRTQQLPPWLAAPSRAVPSRMGSSPVPHPQLRCGSSHTDCSSPPPHPPCRRGLLTSLRCAWWIQSGEKDLDLACCRLLLERKVSWVADLLLLLAGMKKGDLLNTGCWWKEEQRGGVLVIIFDLLLARPFGGRKKGDLLIAGGKEEQRRGVLVIIFDLLRAHLEEETERN
ncbi:unnamed protein product [Urochloa humidicola]